MTPAPDYTLYLVLTPELCGDSNPLDVAEKAVAGGVGVVQMRAPNWSKRDRYLLALGLKERLHGLNVPLIINDDVDIALACGAEGVHVGQSDLPVLDARRLLGEEALLGLSISVPEQMQAAAALPGDTLDYVGIGPAFPTGSKTDTAPVLGLEKLAEIAALSPFPSVAIGGIDAGRAAAVAATGVTGIAVISAICANPYPQTAAEELRKAFEQGKRTPS